MRICMHISMGALAADQSKPPPGLDGAAYPALELVARDARLGDGSLGGTEVGNGASVGATLREFGATVYTVDHDSSSMQGTVTGRER